MDLIETGKIVNTHGVRGELKLLVWTNDLNAFTNIKTLTVGTTDYTVASMRVHKGAVLVQFAEVSDLETAEGLKNKTVFVPRTAFSLPEGNYFIADLLGISVVDETTGELYGILTDVTQTGANDVYEITHESGTKRYIPAIKACVKSTSIAEKIMKIHVMEGLFD